MRASDDWHNQADSMQRHNRPLRDICALGQCPGHGLDISEEILPDDATN
jgi:hypothetical protein